MIDQYLTFSINRQNYGIKISAIREINRISEITQIPEAPPYVAGVMNLRGKVIPVVTMRLRMNLAEAETTKETCTIVVETRAGQIGVIVDSVSSVINLDNKDIDSTPVQQQQENYVVGIGKLENSMVMLVDIEKCLGETSFPQAA